MRTNFPVAQACSLAILPAPARKWHVHITSRVFLTLESRSGARRTASPITLSPTLGIVGIRGREALSMVTAPLYHEPATLLWKPEIRRGISRVPSRSHSYYFMVLSVLSIALLESQRPLTITPAIRVEF